MRTQPVKLRSHVSLSSTRAFHSSGDIYPSIDAYVASAIPVIPSLTSAVAPALSVANKHQCLMLLTIGIDYVTQCRQLLMKTCGDGIVFIRTQPVARAAKIKVWLGVSDAFTGQVMDTVMRALPSAEFGRITHESA
jgi:hypothetical protein